MAAIDITAAVLAGGQGTRLRSVLKDCPKVLAPVAGRPFVAYVLDQLLDAGIETVVMLTGYLGSRIREVLGQTHRGMRLVYHEESSPAGTGGALRDGGRLIKSSRILLLNGDSYCRLDVQGLIDAHDSSGSPVTIATAQVRDAARFNTVRFTAGGRIDAFHETGMLETRAWVNAGWYVVNREIVDEIAPEGEISLERELFPLWATRGWVGAFKTRSRMLDIGIPAGYAAATRFVQTARKGATRHLHRERRKSGASD